MLLAKSNSLCELKFIQCPENPTIGSYLHTDNQSKLFHPIVLKSIIQGDQKVSVHLMITIQKVTSNVQSVRRQSPDIYWHAELCSQRPCSV